MLFLSDRRGNFSMMLVITMPVLLLSAGLAFDVSNMLTARSRLQSAVDAAVLASSHLKDAGKSREDIFDEFLATNIAADSALENAKGELIVSKGVNHIETRGTATADVRLHLMHLFGAKAQINVESGAFESTNELEVAMVLDNTGSMGAARTKALKDAAKALVDILEETALAGRKVRAALVPFVTSVNVNGEAYKEAWIDTAAQATYHGANFDPTPEGNKQNHLNLFAGLGVPWKGCVEARPAPYNLSDDPPDPEKPDTLFVPYFAPDNPGDAAKSPNSGTAWNNSYLEDAYGKDDKAMLRQVGRYFDRSVKSYIHEKGPRSTGPNYACPTPIQPLTSDFDRLRAEIGKMIYWEGSGTNVSEGLAWGMRVLSPGEPYSEGASFDEPSVSKALVVFTDGENTVFGASSQPYNTSDYGAYSFLDSGRTGTTSRSTQLTNVNTWTQTMCTNLKNRKVLVFTVLLGADTAANRKLYSACATQPSYYYPTDDVSQLEAIFSRIGATVAQLYLTH